MRKIDYFNKATAEKTGIDVKIVAEVNKWYWRYGVKKNLSQANYNGIYIKNFGTIIVSRRKLRKEIAKIIKNIRRCKRSTWLTEKRKGLALDALYTNLKRLLERRNQIANDYYTKTKLRNERVANRIPKIITEGDKGRTESVGGSVQ